MTTRLADRLTAPANVAAAWRWLAGRRTRHPANADIWHLRHHRAWRLPALLDQVATGRWQFAPMQRITRADGEDIVLWSAEDALVLKLLTGALQTVLPVHTACTHVKGHGGHARAVRQAHRWLAGGSYRHVCKTDIRGYYAHIDKAQLMGLLRRHIDDAVVLDLLAQFLDYSVEWGGNLHTPRRGIPRACPLSPLLAGFHLYELDRVLARRQGVRYLRFMDDLLILAHTRGQLRRAVATMNRWFAQAGLEQHPDKTFIGRVERGFDWLGFRLADRGVATVAAGTLAKMLAQVRALYEHARVAAPEGVARRVATYRRRWAWWVGSCAAGRGRDTISGYRWHPVENPWSDP